MLLDFIVGLKQAGSISAKQCCSLSWWIGKAGLGGEFEKLGVRPDLTESQSGEYSRHFHRYQNNDLGSLDVYQVKVGRRIKCEATRRFDALPVRLPHEAFAEEIIATPNARADLDAAIANSTLPPRYHTHEVVRNASAGVVFSL